MSDEKPEYITDEERELSLEALFELINAELARWRTELGIADPAHVVEVNAFALDMHHFVLKDMLVEAGIIDNDEYRRRFAARSLENMRMHFDRYKEFAEMQKRQAIVDRIVPGHIQHRDNHKH